MSFPDATQIVLMNHGYGAAQRLEFCFKAPQDHGLPNLEHFPLTALSSSIYALRNLPNNQPAGEQLSALGSALGDALRNHPGHDRLESAISQARVDAPRPIHVVLPYEDRMRADSVPWEVACDANGNFLGLRETCPVVRIAQGGTEDTGNAPESVAVDEIRLTAVLGARGAPSRQAFEALRDGLSQWQLGVRALFLVEDSGLRDEINALGDARFEAELTPPEDNALIVRISRSKPHLLHLLAHGTAEDGGYLEVNTRASLGGMQAIRLNARHIYKAGKGSLLLHLAACSGAEVTEDTSSLALGLMAEGTRAVVAMREPISFEDACEFMRALTVETGQLLDARLRPGERTPLHWGGAVTLARGRLCGNGAVNGGACKSWTLPVLYLQPDPSFVTVPRRGGRVEQGQGSFDAPGGGVEDLSDADRFILAVEKIAELERQAAEFDELRPDIAVLIRNKIEELRARIADL